MYKFLSVVVISGWGMCPHIANSAGCSSEVRILGDDLKGVTLSQQKTQQLASILFDARKYCFAQEEEKALKYINKARLLVGLKATTGEFDWENVPLESLEMVD